MDMFELIINRRAVRNFNPGELSKRVIEKILNAAIKIHDEDDRKPLSLMISFEQFGKSE